MKLTVNEELPKNEQGAAIIGDDITEIIEDISNEVNAINDYVEQMKNWTSNTYISDREYKAMQYNISRIIGGGYRIVENGRYLQEDFGV